MSNGADGHTTRPDHRGTPGRPTQSDPAPSRPITIPDRVWVPAAAAFALALVFIAALLVRADGDVSLLVHAAPPDTDAAAAPGSLTVQGPDDGFDGQFFYRLGVHPWTTDEVVGGVTNDLPALRNARWGYGALAWAASGGDADLVPWSLVGLNVAAMAAVGAIGGGLARSTGRHAAWGVLLALWPGFAYSLSMDTSELVASTFLLAGLLALRGARWLTAAALFGAAVITRDTTAVVPAGVALVGGYLWVRMLLPGPKGAAAGSEAPEGRGPERAGAPPRVRATGPGASAGLLIAGVVPLVLFIGWQLVQRARFGELPLTSSGDNNLSVPFSGLLDQLGQVLPPSGGEELFRLVCIVGLSGLLAAAGWSLVASRRSGPAGTGAANRSADGAETAAPGADAPSTGRPTTAGPEGGPAVGTTGATNHVGKPTEPTGLSVQPTGASPEAVTWSTGFDSRWALFAPWVLAVAVVVVLNAYLWSGATAFMRAATEAGLLSTLVLLGARGRHADRLLAAAGLGLGGLWLLTAVAQLSKLG